MYAAGLDRSPEVSTEFDIKRNRRPMKMSDASIISGIVSEARKRVQSFPQEMKARLRSAIPKLTYEKPYAYPVSNPELFRPADERMIDWVKAGTDRNLLLYVHIPWCLKKCNWCFYDSSQGKPSEDAVDRYIAALGKELSIYRSRLGRDLLSEVIYIGGGTPTILEPHQIDSLFRTIRRHVSFTDNAFLISESSPGTLTKEKVNTLVRNGINRASIGIQTLDDRILRFSNRDHDASQAINAYRLLREGNIPEINIDLMVGMPNQSVESFVDTVEKTIRLQPSSISFLDFRLIPGSALYRDISTLNPGIPGWEECLVMRAVYQMMENTDYVANRGHYYVLPDEMRHSSTRSPCLDWRVERAYQIGIGFGAYTHLGEVIVGNATGPEYLVALEKNTIPVCRGLVLDEQKRNTMKTIRAIGNSMRIPDSEEIHTQYTNLISFLHSNGLIDGKHALTRDGRLFAEEIIYSLINPDGFL